MLVPVLMENMVILLHGNANIAIVYVQNALVELNLNVMNVYPQNFIMQIIRLVQILALLDM